MFYVLPYKIFLISEFRALRSQAYGPLAAFSGACKVTPLGFKKICVEYKKCCCNTAAKSSRFGFAAVLQQQNLL